MKLINSKGQLFEKVSVIDLLIVILLIASFSMGYSFLSKKETTQLSTQTTVTYLYETFSVPESFALHLKKDIPVYNSSKNYNVGVLKDFSVKPFEITTKNLTTGEYSKQVVPEQFTVTMTIEANATVDEYNVWANQENLKIGNVFPIKGKGFATNGVIILIREAE